MSPAMIERALRTASPCAARASGRTMPSPSVFDLYLPRATEISWDQVASAGISGTLSAASNPFGKVNPKGIYHVRVPGSGRPSM